MNVKTCNNFVKVLYYKLLLFLFHSYQKLTEQLHNFNSETNIGIKNPEICEQNMLYRTR